MTPTNLRRRIVASAAALLAVTSVPAVAAAGGSSNSGSSHPGQSNSGPSEHGCANRNLNSTDKLLACIDGDDVIGHLEALQSIADQNGGTRASGTPGYEASADYVAGLLEDAGYMVKRQVFDFSLFTEISSSLGVDGAAIETQTFEYSGSGTVDDGNVVPVDLALGIGNASTSGCETTDFDPALFVGPSDIALIQRGTCDFSVKALNAQDAGAEAVIIFNQGNTDGADRQDLINGTLGDGVVGTLTIPVLDASYPTGVQILDAASASVAAATEIETRSTQNVIADFAGKNPDNVVMAGAHLDSVQEGAGINDNGSGSAALLTVALELANNKKFTPQNSLRFAWWGAEEAGLVGSTKYIFDPNFGISDADYEALAAYLNFDMVGSPNFVYGVYDADESSFEAPVVVPDGSAALEDLFEAYYSWQDIPYDDSEFSGRSDYQAFIDVGIPASGLFTGAEEVKTDQQAAIWGGTAGEWLDPCYHQACDAIDNVSAEALDVNIDAIGYAIFNLAGSTELVNGVPGAKVKGVAPQDVVLDGPQGTFVTGGGALSADHDNAIS
jgi:Zn-dependent M28 family amino/carboxypeptidase